MYVKVKELKMKFLFNPQDINKTPLPNVSTAVASWGLMTNRSLMFPHLYRVITCLSNSEKFYWTHSPGGRIKVQCPLDCYCSSVVTASSYSCGTCWAHMLNLLKQYSNLVTELRNCDELNLLSFCWCFVLLFCHFRNISIVFKSFYTCTVNCENKKGL